MFTTDLVSALPPTFKLNDVHSTEIGQNLVNYFGTFSILFLLSQIFLYFLFNVFAKWKQIWRLYFGPTFVWGLSYEDILLERAHMGEKGNFK